MRTSRPTSRHGSPPQVVWLQCGNLSTIEMQAWLSKTFAHALERLKNGEACVEIPYGLENKRGQSKGV